MTFAVAVGRERRDRATPSSEHAVAGEKRGTSDGHQKSGKQQVENHDVHDIRP
jgi:hypothetical protein